MSTMRFILAALCWVVVTGNLHAAVRANDPIQLQAALDAGEDINVIGPGGQTPLMHGVLTGSSERNIFFSKFFFNFFFWGLGGIREGMDWQGNCQKMGESKSTSCE